jgi:hypothetical protein
MSDLGHHHVPANPLTIYHAQALPQLMWLITSLSRQKIRFNTWPDHVEFVDEVAQSFLQALGLTHQNCFINTP